MHRVRSFSNRAQLFLTNDPRKREALAVARREIARRLARICASLPAEEFEKLVDRMALVQWKYDTFPHLALAGEPDPLTTAERAILERREA